MAYVSFPAYSPIHFYFLGNYSLLPRLLKSVIHGLLYFRVRGDGIGTRTWYRGRGGGSAEGNHSSTVPKLEGRLFIFLDPAFFIS